MQLSRYGGCAPLRFLIHWFDLSDSLQVKVMGKPLLQEL